MFPTAIDEILERISKVDPLKYAQTRNYGDGAVTFLSPYISRGVISTKQVFDHVVTMGLPWEKIEKLVQELAWRDYWQQVWIAKGENIHTDMKSRQRPVSNLEIPDAVIKASTGIEEVDRAINHLYETGYMHNHMRMYVASICCNISYSHWREPSRWMYAHLLDGDLASNQLSWQWVAGTFSKKKYYANQENINKFFHSDQIDTFLDVSYEELMKMKTPEILSETSSLDLKTILPPTTGPTVRPGLKTLVYNYYNLDPNWHKGEGLQRVLLLEPSFFEAHPVSSLCIDFVLDLAKNIADISIFVGEFKDLQLECGDEIHFKEHPTNSHYVGTEEPREWLTGIQGYFPSFFSFWKKGIKELSVKNHAS
ncbi:MAG: FAD-binding domain-containing protein [Cytophagales bacterium]